MVVEDFSFDAPKTRKFVDILANLNVDDRKVLLVTSKQDDNLHKSLRNIPYKQVAVAPQFSAYDVLNAQVVIVQKEAVGILNEVLG